MTLIPTFISVVPSWKISSLSSSTGKSDVEIRNLIQAELAKIGVGKSWAPIVSQMVDVESPSLMLGPRGKVAPMFAPERRFLNAFDEEIVYLDHEEFFHLQFAILDI